MSASTTIEWTDATWNPVTGCSVISPGCANCYAMKLAGTRLRNLPSRKGLTRKTKAGPVWNGKVRLNEQWLRQPLTWAKPRRIFVCAHGDLFHKNVPDAWIDKVFAVMAAARQHTFQVLTKRADRAKAYLSNQPMARRRWETIVQTELNRPTVSPPPILPNVWLGVSAEDQRRADERIPLLLATPAAKWFVSLEPLLGPIDLHWALSKNRLDIGAGFLQRGMFSPGLEALRPLDWVIVGGESGPDPRPVHPAWVREIRDACANADVPLFFKQWGAWKPREEWSPRLPGGRFEVMVAIMRDGTGCPDDVAPQDVGAHRMALVGKKAAGARLDGRLHREFPR